MSAHAFNTSVGISYLYGDRTYIGRYFYHGKHHSYHWLVELAVTIIYPFVVATMEIEASARFAYKQLYVPLSLWVREAQMLIVLVLSAVMLISLTLVQFTL